MTNKNDWHIIEFFTPISEVKSEVKEGYDDFIIKGIAINETTTHNGHKYIAEELQKASSHLIGKKLLVDHRNEVDAIKGVIINSSWNPVEKRIEFEGSVKDKTMREMIRDGRLSDVSIGAFARDLVKEDDGSMVAKGLEIVELSFVAVPADSKANFGMAMANNFSIKESLLREMVTCPECDAEMEDKEALKKHMKSKHDKEMGENIHTVVRRYGMEENKLVELEESNKKLLESHQEALKELTILRNEKRQNTINEYKRMCSVKKVKEKDVSNLSEDTINLLIEQIKDIVVEEKQMRSLVSEDIDTSGMNNTMIERSQWVKGTAIWEMPDSSKIRELHKNLPFFNK